MSNPWDHPPAPAPNPEDCVPPINPAPPEPLPAIATEIIPIEREWPEVKEAKKRMFLRSLSVCGNIWKACSNASISRATFNKWQADDFAFRDAMIEAGAAAVDRLEQEAWRRGKNGNKRFKFYKGTMIMVDDEDGKSVPYIEREYSDSVLMFLLKAARPEKFRENKNLQPAINVNINAAGIPEGFVEAGADDPEAERNRSGLPDGLQRALPPGDQPSRDA